ncbi:hypothetical protein PO124_20680 [Bacillus licheniformis]|nr:hypothetical protein [Bacillus licheniformis]
MIKQTDQLAESMKADERQKMSVHKALTMASLIEEEATEKRTGTNLKRLYNRISKTCHCKRIRPFYTRLGSIKPCHVQRP